MSTIATQPGDLSERSMWRRRTRSRFNSRYSGWQNWYDEAVYWPDLPAKRPSVYPHEAPLRCRSNSESFGLKAEGFWAFSDRFIPE